MTRRAKKPQKEVSGSDVPATVGASRFKELLGSALDRVRQVQTSKSYRFLAPRMEEILHAYAGPGAGRITYQQLFHWRTAGNDRRPSSRDVLWAVLLGLICHEAWSDTAMKDDPRVKGGKNPRICCIEDATTMANDLKFATLPSSLIDAARLGTKALLDRLKSPSGAISTYDVVETLGRLLHGTEATGSNDVRSLLCVAAISPPRIGSYPQARQMLLEFIRNGGAYAIVVPTHPNAGRRTAAGHREAHSLDLARTIVQQLREELTGKAKACQERVRVVCIGDQSRAESVLQLTPPLAGIEARPVYLYSEPKSNPLAHSDRVACLVTARGSDWFILRDPTDRATMPGDLERIQNQEIPSISEFFLDLVDCWKQTNGFASAKPGQFIGNTKNWMFFM